MSDGGQWQSADAACSGATPYCSQGSCTATPPSCAPGGSGLTNCGASSESCCTSLEVQGGTYYRAYDDSVADGGPTGLAEPATISGFRLDKYDVTVGRFRQFVNAVLPPNGGPGWLWLPPAGSGKHTHLNGGQGLVNSAGGTSIDGGVVYETGWDPGSWKIYVAPTNANLNCAPYSTWTGAAGSQENEPINCVTWYEAYAFCIWDGGFLPSGAEWEFAAAGGSQQREYPWGSTAPGTSNQYAIYGCYYPSGSGTCSGAGNIAPVGTAALGAGLWGHLDLAGNLNQWNLDSLAPYACADCASLSSGNPRLAPGGTFEKGPAFLLPPSATHSALDPTSRYDDVGFRCARTP